MFSKLSVCSLFTRLLRGKAATEKKLDSNGGVLFVSGEPKTPGHMYRIARQAAGAAQLGYRTCVVSIEEVEQAYSSSRSKLQSFVRLPRPNLVIIWRARWSEPLESAIAQWKASGACVAYDIDDYMFDPDLAKVEIIDGIRALSLPEKAVADMYRSVNRALNCCDVGIAPTQTLARAMRRHGSPAHVLPNGFDEYTLLESRRALAEQRWSPSDGIVRIGYAAGSRTHQRDFAVAAAAVAKVLRARPQCRLVMFYSGQERTPLVDVSEYPEFDGLEDRIEWRSLKPLEQLPLELARFDVNLVPLQVANPFCEAKSELKFFEAALVEVASIASPTAPYVSAIVDGKTGILAHNEKEWEEALFRLVDDSVLRRAIGRMAYLSVLWTYGPDGRRQAFASFYNRVVAQPADRAREFLSGRLIEARHKRLPFLPEAEELFRHGTGTDAEVAVVIPCYNYAQFVTEALDSVACQEGKMLELVVVDDSSTDGSLQVVDRWLRRHATRFSSCRHLRTLANAGLSLARNIGFATAESPFVLPLDADNKLAPDCIRLLHERLVGSSASAAHPTIVRFGSDAGVNRALPWDPDRLKRGNYIDAMALIRKSAWSRVGGYEQMPLGWEDYDFWCRFVESGLWSVAVPDAEAFYRVHGSSMLHTTTDLPENRAMLIEFLEQKYSWLDISRA
jgi:GT2 family glycosyltransferase/glycosyltransferase involved in cell wall biosynthesis